MFRKIVDVLKEVFWIKPSPKKRKSATRKVVRKSPAKKKIAKKKKAPVTKPAPRLKPTVAKKVAKALLKEIDPSLTEIGLITHYFDRIKVCVVKINQGTVLIGDKLTIIGDKTKFVQKVWSMQIESEDVKVAKKGQIIGIKVDKIVVVGDKVYK